MKYIRYFFYIAFNWSFRIAWFVVRHEMKGAKKYGIADSLRIEYPSHMQTSFTTHVKNASEYQPVNFYVLEYAFEWLKNNKRLGNVFLDIGCGKARTLIVAGHYGYQQLLGVEFSQSLCAEANLNLEKLCQSFSSVKFQIECADAASYAIANEVDTIFMFNPFDEVVMKEVIKNVLISLQKKKRKLHVLYVNALHVELWLQAGFKELHAHKYLTYLQVSILANEAD
jgi:SAM-dependent methyltransferase